MPDELYVKLSNGHESGGDVQIRMVPKPDGRLRPMLEERCSILGCLLFVTIWRDGRQLVMQHGPNPEHVALCDLRAHPPGEATRRFQADWLARIHAPEETPTDDA